MLAGHLGTARMGPTSSFTWYFYCTSEQICECLNNEKSNNIIANWKVISIVSSIERARHTKASSNIEISPTCLSALKYWFKALIHEIS